MQTQLPPVYYIVFTAVTALGVLLQAFVLLAMYFAIREAVRKFHATTDELKLHVMPAVVTARSLLDDISPKLKIASTNLVEASHSLRNQADHVTVAVDDLLNKTTAQVVRIHEMAGAILDSVEHASNAFQRAVSVPLRQVSGVFVGIKAGLDVLRRKTPPSHPGPNDFGE
jgi:hypothetical protein